MDEMGFQSVFDNAVEEEKAFDTMFGGEEDNDLIGIVLGESADEETLDDGISADELKDELENDEDEKCCDSSDSFDINKGNLGELGCKDCGVADAVQSTAPDEESIDSEIEKSANKIDEFTLMNMVLGEDGDVEGETPAPEVEVDEPDPVEDEEPAPAAEPDPVDADADSAVNDNCYRKEDTEAVPDEDGSEPETEEQVEAEEAFLSSLAESDKNDEEDEESEEDEDDDELEDAEDDDEDEEELEDVENKKIDEASFISAILGEASDDVNETEEDEIIADVEDDSELSDKEVEDLTSEDDDIDLIDSILGEE